MSKVQYKVVKLTIKGEKDRYHVYVGYERKAGFKWTPHAILGVDTMTQVDAFFARNEIEATQDTEYADITTGCYDPNDGIVMHGLLG